MISTEYLAANRTLHADDPTYGTSGWKYASDVLRLCQSYATLSILDYGCGKGTLAAALDPFPIAGYDPAVPEFAAPPEPADIVVCGDVLEHIEPEHLPAVLAHVRSLTRRVTLWVIATRPASKTLPDGRNCHLIVQGAPWWTQQLANAGHAVCSVRQGRKRELVVISHPDIQ